MSNRLRVKVPAGRISRRMQRDHTDVLQNIEFFIVQAWRGSPAVDDAAVREALVAHLNYRQAASPPVAAAWDAVNSARQCRRDMGSDVSEEVWRDCLRTILHSVKNHSTFLPGETSYLDFVAPFVP